MGAGKSFAKPHDYAAPHIMDARKLDFTVYKIDFAADAQALVAAFADRAEAEDYAAQRVDHECDGWLYFVLDGSGFAIWTSF